MKQIANVAALPGIVGKSVGLPDIHSGYGFAIGNMVSFARIFLKNNPRVKNILFLKAAFDMNNPLSIVSPGGN